MMELEVRHWITNHEAQIGTGAYGASGVPAAGLTAAPAKKPADQPQSLGPKDAKSNTIGNLFYGSNGYLAIDGYDSYKTWLTDQDQPGPQGKAAGDHYANFVECIRSRRAQDIHSPIEEAHISTTLVHLANTSYRLGRTVRFDPAKEQVVDDEEANRFLRGSYRAPTWCRKKFDHYWRRRPQLTMRILVAGASLIFVAVSAFLVSLASAGPHPPDRVSVAV